MLFLRSLLGISNSGFQICVCHGVPCANRQLWKLIKSGIEVNEIVKFESILCQHSEFWEEAREWLDNNNNLWGMFLYQVSLGNPVLVGAHFTRNWRWRNGCVAEKYINELMTNIYALLASDLQPDLGMCWVSMCTNTAIIRQSRAW